jgi:hypothetical protein
MLAVLLAISSFILPTTFILLCSPGRMSLDLAILGTVLTFAMFLSLVTDARDHEVFVGTAT